MRSTWIGLSSILLFSSGCVSYDSLVNYKENFPEPGKFKIENPPDIRIQPNDVLSIDVFSSDVETAAPFNLTQIGDQGLVNSVEAIQLEGYLVDKEGFVDFPVLGRIELEGMTISEAREYIKGQLTTYLRNPVVKVRLLNFTVTVSGEVLQQGSLTVFNERISIPEALSRAGGLSQYANRSNVKLIREENGMRSFHTINLLSSQIFQSEYYYLKQNDLLYVEPVKAKTGAVQDQTSKTIPIITAAATLVAVLVSILQ